MNLICDKLSPCPQSTPPYTNLSSELPDQDIFIGINWGDPQWKPPLGSHWYAWWCYGECDSVISQADADECAFIASLTCGLGTVPDPTRNNPKLYYSQAVTCTVKCPDGTTFSWTLPPGTAAATSQQQANNIAYSAACFIANQFKKCKPPCPGGEAILPDATVGTPYSQQLVVSFGTPPLTFALDQYIFPDWVAISSSGLITGTPVTADAGINFKFPISVTDSKGKSCKQNVAIMVQPSNPPIYRYWTMEEPALSDRVDKYHSDVLPAYSNGVNPSSAAGKIGNALHLDNLNSVAQANISCALANYGNPAATTGAGFSLAFWIYVNNLNEGAEGNRVFGAHIDLGGSFWIELDFGDASGGLFPAGWNVMYQDINGNSNYLTPFGVTIPTGAWSFVHIFFDGAGKVGVSINNGPESTVGTGLVSGSATTYGIAFYASSADYAGPGVTPTNVDLLIDEVAASLNGRLTPAQAAYLYNAGAGRTWPITLP